MRKTAIVVSGVLMLTSILINSPPEKLFAQAETIKVGAITALSGPAAPWGIGAVRVADIYIEKVNKGGGLKIGGKMYKVEHFAYDHKGSAAEAINHANRMIFEDKVKYIYTCCIQACCAAIQTVSEPNEVFFSNIGWGKALLGPDKPYSFRSATSELEIPKLSWSWVLKEYPNIKTVACINPNDGSGWTARDSVMAVCQKRGLKVVATELYERGLPDFTPFLTRIIAKKPDAISFGVCPPGDVGLMVKQAYGLGFRGFKEGTAVADLRVVLKIAGAEACEGLFSLMGYDVESSELPKGMRDLAAAYRAKHGEIMPTSGRDGIVPLEVLAEAWQNSGRVDVKGAIAQIEKQRKFETSYGPVVVAGKGDYGINRQFYYTHYASMVKGGKVVFISKIWPELE